MRIAMGRAHDSSELSVLLHNCCFNALMSLNSCITIFRLSLSTLLYTLLVARDFGQIACTWPVIMNLRDPPRTSQAVPTSLENVLNGHLRSIALRVHGTICCLRAMHGLLHAPLQPQCGLPSASVPHRMPRRLRQHMHIVTRAKSVLNRL